MQKISTMRTSGKNIFEGQLTIGLDLGDRSSAYCVLNEAGEIVFEHKLVTTPEAMKQVFGSMPRCRIAMETGTHSPWVSRLLTALGHEVIVGHAQKVRLSISHLVLYFLGKSADFSSSRQLLCRLFYFEQLLECGGLPPLFFHLHIWPINQASRGHQSS
jgi:hypothetical protein